MWFKLLISIAIFGFVAGSMRPPHVILIMADDLGWNDVGFHGSDQIPTPNIDALAYHGLILNQHYTAPMCSPSRASFLTGKYPFHLGMQHMVIVASSPWGLPPNETILPELLNRAGYESHLVGKWHLGFHKEEYTPTRRGFKSHYGYWAGYQGYLDHTSTCMSFPCEGYDMRRNLEVDWTARGRYSTDVFTEEAVKVISKHDTQTPLFLFLSHLAVHTGTKKQPLVAPDEYIAKFAHIADPERRVYAAMLSKLDESVGEVIAALRKKEMLDNSIVIFMSDNGAPTEGFFANKGSNYPLRGIKGNLFEGGSRVAAAMWSPLIKKPQRVAHQLMHISDWVPTLCSAAGIKLGASTMDGVDMWKSLTEDLPSPRNEMVYNIDEVFKSGAIRQGNWKYIDNGVEGFQKKYGWYGESSEERYDVEAVFKSNVGAALGGYAIEKHLYKGDNTVTTLVPLLNSTKVWTMRRESRIDCRSQPEFECVESEPCLFNLKSDPCERNNLAKGNPQLMAQFDKKLKQYKNSLVKARNQPEDKLSNPILHGGAWSCWQDDGESTCCSCAMMALTLVIIFIVYRSVQHQKQE